MRVILTLVALAACAPDYDPVHPSPEWCELDEESEAICDCWADGCFAGDAWARGALRAHAGSCSAGSQRWTPEPEPFPKADECESAWWAGYDECYATTFFRTYDVTCGDVDE